MDRHGLSLPFNLTSCAFNCFKRGFPCLGQRVIWKESPRLVVSGQCQSPLQFDKCQVLCFRKCVMLGRIGAIMSLECTLKGGGQGAWAFPHDRKEEPPRRKRTERPAAARRAPRPPRAVRKTRADGRVSRVPCAVTAVRIQSPSTGWPAGHLPKLHFLLLNRIKVSCSLLVV